MLCIVFYNVRKVSLSRFSFFMFKKNNIHLKPVQNLNITGKHPQNLNLEQSSFKTKHPRPGIRLIPVSHCGDVGWTKLN